MEFLQNFGDTNKDGTLTRTVKSLPYQEAVICIGME